MNIFLSWSKSQSKELANILKEFLPRVIQSIDVFFSPDIPKGNQWLQTIHENIKKADYAIIILTKENLNEEWIMYESGALAQRLSYEKITPLLFNLTPSEISNPLKFFQMTTFSKEDMYKMFESINLINSSKKLSESDLKYSFKKSWNEFKKKSCIEPKQVVGNNQIDYSSIFINIEDNKDECPKCHQNSLSTGGCMLDEDDSVLKTISAKCDRCGYKEYFK